jgi:hypothetical protein
MAVVTVTNVEKETGGPMQTNQVAASAAASQTGTPVVICSMLAVLAVTVIMWLAYHDWIKPIPVHFTASYVPYAGIIVITAGLERFLEPLSQVLMPSSPAKQAAATSKSTAQAAAADPGQTTAVVQEKVVTAADDQASADTLRTKRAIVFWAIASACGLVISGAFGFFILQSVAIGHVNSFLDLAVTGLTIGAGTKPVHDLITSVQAKAASSS